MARNEGVSAELERAFWLNISLLRGFSGHYRFSGIVQGWSLTVEETFYLSAPLFFYFGHRAGRRAAWLALAGYVLAALALGLALTATIHGRWFDFFPSYLFLFTSTFFGRAVEFAAGAGLALLLLRRAAEGATPPSPGGGFTYGGMAGSFLVVLAMAAVTRHYQVQFSTNHPLGLLLNNVLLPGFIALFFYGLLYENTGLARLLSHPVADLLGKSSYSFYLLHNGFLPTEIALRMPIVSALAYCALFVLLVGASIATYFLLEEPANKFLRRLARPARLGSVVPAP